MFIAEQEKAVLTPQTAGHRAPTHSCIISQNVLPPRLPDTEHAIGSKVVRENQLLMAWHSKIALYENA